MIQHRAVRPKPLPVQNRGIQTESLPKTATVLARGPGLMMFSGVVAVVVGVLGNAAYALNSRDDTE